MMRRLCLTLLLLVAAFELACAHQGAAGYASGYASGVPLGSFDCYDTGDIYSPRISPCGGIAYGDYEQYPTFTPLAAREVTLTQNRQHPVRVVAFPGFLGTAAEASWSSQMSDPGTSSSAPASTPRMDPVPVGASSPSPGPTTVSPRPN